MASANLDLDTKLISSLWLAMTSQAIWTKLCLNQKSVMFLPGQPASYWTLVKEGVLTLLEQLFFVHILKKIIIYLFII